MQLILGGARSGKSRLAQQKAEAWRKQTGGQLLYLATGEAGDNEMHARIEAHRQERGAAWKTLEEPISLARTLSENAAPDTCILVDCLTLWVSNCLHRGVWHTERDALLTCIDKMRSQTMSPPWIFVSNEVGSGVVPLGELSREFVDASGWLHQALAERMDSVTLVVAGLPMSLK